MRTMKRRGALFTIQLLAIWLPSVAIATPVSPAAMTGYLQKRSALVAQETAMRIGGKETLNAEETQVNDLLMNEKRNEMDDDRLNRKGYLNSASFYLSKEHIDKSKIFEIIKTMPKGAALHLHDLAVGSGRWVVKNATYRQHAHMCVDGKGFIRLGMFDTPPQPSDCNWTTVESQRNAARDRNAFDEMLIQNISLLGNDPLTTYQTTDDVWDRFNAYFDQVMGLLYYAPVMRDYWKQALLEFYQDNVQYIEMRIIPSGLFLLDQKPLGAEYAIKLYKEVVEEFLQEYPDFSGAKIIISNLRILPVADILEDIKATAAIRAKYPGFVLGYDLVGQEDPNFSLEHYLEALLYPSQQSPPVDLPFFFHAAETNWQGTEVDYNLVDAILLNTSRIGHGYGLIKHPKLAQMVKEKGIAVEINPISNQLLGLVKDLRNHALIPLLADDFPIVISSDDPGAWSAAPLSHDFYVAFMTMSGRDADLTLLKQLAKNSIKYSMMSEDEKTKALQLWQVKWDAFITETVRKVCDSGDPIIG